MCKNELRARQLARNINHFAPPDIFHRAEHSSDICYYLADNSENKKLHRTTHLGPVSLSQPASKLLNWLSKRDSQKLHKLLSSRR